jgi:hypothetical protein
MFYTLYPLKRLGIFIKLIYNLVITIKHPSLWEGLGGLLVLSLELLHASNESLTAFD